MSKKKLSHYPTCRSDYPEKKKGEKPQAATVMEISKYQEVVVCNDCGASLVRKKEKKG